MSDSQQQQRQTAPLRLGSKTSPLDPRDGLHPYEDHLVLVKRSDSKSSLASENEWQREERQRVERVEEFRREGAYYSGLFETMTQKLSNRVRMLRFALEVYRRPQDTWKTALKSLRQDHATMVAAILEQMSQAGVRKRVTIAVERFEGASQAMQEVRTLLAKIEDKTPYEAFPFIAEASIPKVKGKLYLLTTYDLLFKSDPVLNQMFPIIPRAPKDSKVPTRKTTPKGDLSEAPKHVEAKPVQTMPTPPPSKGLLKSMLKRFKNST